MRSPWRPTPVRWTGNTWRVCGPGCQSIVPGRASQIRVSCRCSTAAHLRRRRAAVGGPAAGFRESRPRSDLWIAGASNGAPARYAEAALPGAGSSLPICAISGTRHASPDAGKARELPTPMEISRQNVRIRHAGSRRAGYRTTRSRTGARGAEPHLPAQPAILAQPAVPRYRRRRPRLRPRVALRQRPFATRVHRAPVVRKTAAGPVLAGRGGTNAGRPPDRRARHIVARLASSKRELR